MLNRKSLGALVCALGLTHARVPVAGARLANSVLLPPNFPNLGSEYPQVQVDPPVPPGPPYGPPGRPNGPPGPPPPPPEEMPPYMPPDGNTGIVPPDMAEPYYPGDYGTVEYVQSQCNTEYWQLCTDDYYPPDQPLYMASTKVIMSAARRLLGHVEHEVPAMRGDGRHSNGRDHPNRAFGRHLPKRTMMHMHEHQTHHEHSQWRPHGWHRHEHEHEHHEHEHEHEHHEHGRPAFHGAVHWHGENWHEDHDHEERPPCPRGPPLGFGRSGDLCLRNNFDQLSDGCKEAIKALDATAGTGSSSPNEGEEGDYEYDDEDEHEAPLGFLWISAVIWTSIFACCLKRARRMKAHNKQVNAVLGAVIANPEIKAIVESTAGTDVPAPKKICCCRLWLGPVLVGIVAFLHLTHAISATISVASEDDEDAAEALRTVALVFGCLGMAALIFTCVRRVRTGRWCRGCRRDCCQYTYNGRNNGYVALTGAGVEMAAPPSAADQEVFTGIPVAPPGSNSGEARAYNPPNVL